METKLYIANIQSLAFCVSDLYAMMAPASCSLLLLAFLALSFKAVQCNSVPRSPAASLPNMIFMLMDDVRESGNNSMLIHSLL